MAKQRKSKTTTTSDKLDASYVFWAPTESHPSQVSGLFQNNPAFEEFCAILRQQRAEDYRQANEAIDAMRDDPVLVDTTKSNVLSWQQVL